jgi:hypothetical protein
MMSRQVWVPGKREKEMCGDLRNHVAGVCRLFSQVSACFVMEESQSDLAAASA